MKIAHVINYFQPRLGYQETFLAKEQLKTGHEVIMITSDRYYPFPNFDEAYGPLLGNRICGTGFKLEEGIPTYRLATLFEVKCRVWLIGLEKLIVNFQPDLVISHAILSNSFRLAKLKNHGKLFKLIVDDHLDIYTRKDFLGNLYYRWRKFQTKRHLLPSVDKFVGVTKPTCDFFEKYTGIPSQKIEYIHLASDSDLFQFSKNGRENIRNKFGIKEDDILLLYAGKLNSDKGVDDLIKAFNLINLNKNIFLLLLGDGSSEFKKYLSIISNYKSKSSIHFHPFVPTHELSNYFSASDICIWPKETSTSMLDAASCSRPVVGCDVPTVRERIANQNGLTYEANNIEDLKNKIEYLCNNPQIRKQMGDNGRKLIENEFSWKIISKKFIDCVI